MVLRLYADESGDDRGSIVRVAGYLMTCGQWKSLDAEIGVALEGLSWFHMREGDDRKYPRIYRRLLDTISPETVLCGVSASLNQKEYDDLLSERSGKSTLRYWIGSHYSFLVQAVMNLCGMWCREQERRDEWIAYFFEAGHSSQGDADVLLKLYGKRQYQPEAQLAKYASHTFLAKEGPLSKALIPCDILAWHLTDWHRGGSQGEDLKRLLGTHTIYRDFSADDIRGFIARSKSRMRRFDKLGRPRK